MTNSRMDLATELAVFKTVRAAIAEAFGLGEDDEAVRDTAEGETNLADYLARLMREAQAASAMASGMSDHIKAMQARKSRLEAKSARIRAIVLHAMVDVDMPKLTAPDFTASRGRSQPPLVIPNDEDVPDDMCRVKREPDRLKIAAALKEAHAIGRAFPYAYFGNGSETLTLRSK